ncbi:MAG: hypothetical protein K0U93_25305 [Gammaproteobacteria bacterium]|nr:hypothetical protein [Gammaproteobacteria bacterium]
MDWTTIVMALLLGLMIAFLIPRAMHMLKNSPKGSQSDWTAALIPIALVALFIVMLMKMV